jgi:hypothetical protein
MSLAFMGLLAAACAMAVLLLNMNLRSTWPWTVKLAATVVTSALLVVVYLAMLALLGWPTSEPLPDRFELIAADVREPTKGGDDQGAIYLWAKPAEDPGSEPRAYRLAYGERLHGQVISALDSSRRGTRQLGTVTGRGSSGPGEQRNVSIRFDDFRGRGLPPKRKR